MADDVPKIGWMGQSGRTYQYWIYEIGTSFTDDVPANYIFSKQTTPGYWAAIYVGQTGDLKERTADHHKMECVRKQGGTHIHAHINGSGEQARLDEETDLVRRLNPPCNG